MLLNKSTGNRCTNDLPSSFFFSFFFFLALFIEKNGGGKLKEIQYHLVE
jgi:hypothetical protein